MTDLTTGLIVIWLTGLLFLAGWWMNFLRLMHNNLAPVAGYSNYEGASVVGTNRISDSEISIRRG